MTLPRCGIAFLHQHPALHTRTLSWFQHRSFASIRRGSYVCQTPESLEQLGGILSANAVVGDVFLLNGDVGTGKTCLARGFIQSLTKRPNLMVTSPTFLLDLSYECVLPTEVGAAAANSVPATVHHMDLYRVSVQPGHDTVASSGAAAAAAASALGRLGIPDVFVNNVCLIEWPQLLFRAESASAFTSVIPESYLNVTITVGDDGDDDTDMGELRLVKLDGVGSRWSAGRFESLLACVHAAHNRTV
jgi:tRNA A37 threonylcarbamoyladenosine biosynthesis protein TsaE